MEKLHTVQEIYKDPESFLNRNIQIGGWVRSNRSSRNFGFLTVQDGSCFQTLQAVYGNHMENFQEISRLNVGSAVIVRGRLVPTPEARQPFEIQAEAVEVEGASTPDYPLQKKTPFSGISADDLPSAAQDQYFSGGVPRPLPGGPRHSLLFPGSGVCLCAYAADYRQRL